MFIYKNAYQLFPRKIWNKILNVFTVFCKDKMQFTMNIW